MKKVKQIVEITLRFELKDLKEVSYLLKQTQKLIHGGVIDWHTEKIREKESNK